jgi:predicted dehydrogenase
MADYRVLIAGCGGMANKWVEYALERPDTEIVGLVDISEANAKKLAERHGLSAPFFTDVREGARAASANLVFDTTIPEVHKTIALAAFEAGCNVMSEKPMAASLADAKEGAAAGETAGRFYAIMQNRRYLRHIRSYRDLLREGTIGKVGFVSADFFIGAHFGGFRDAMKSPLILDMAIHTFDQARFITGADPVSVYCHEFNPHGSWYDGNAAAICIFEMSDGSVFNYRGSWCAEGAPTSWESSWRVAGTKGTAIWDGHGMPYAEVVKPAEGHVFMNAFERVEARPSELAREGHDGCLDEMFAALSEGRKAETDYTDNMMSMKMVFGALESAALGQKIDLR